MTIELIRNGKGKSLLLINKSKNFPCGEFQLGYIASMNRFKLRDIKALRKSIGEFSWATKYFTTLKEALAYCE